MATTQRLGIDITATSRTAAAFAATQRSLTAFEKQGARLRTVFTGMFAGLVGGNLVKSFAQSMISINKHVEPVKKSFTQVDRAWQQFALNVGKGGLNDALINFNNRMAQMTTNFDGLSVAIGGFSGYLVNELAKGFIYTGRAIAFVGDNIEYLKGKFGSFSLSDGLFSGAIISKDADAKVLEWMKSMGLETRSLTREVDGANAAFSKLPPTFDEIAKSGKSAETAFEKLTAIKQRMFENTRTPMEKYLSGMRELEVVQSSLGMSDDLFARQQAKLREEFLGTGKTVKDLGTSLSDTFGSELRGMFDSALDGTFKLKDALSGLIKTLAKSGFDSFLQGSGGGIGSLLGGGGGGIGSLLGKFLGGSFGGLYANGGTLGAGKWGIVGEKGPETIVGPATVIPNRGGGALKVVVNNNVGASVGVREQTGSFGQRELIMTIDKRVANQMADPYSKSSSVLSARGARPSVKQR